MSDKAKETKAEAKAAEPVAGHNSATIPWPTDPAGATALLKRGGIEAAKRVNGDPEKLKNFKRVLRLILQHADAKFEVDTAARKKAKEDAAAATRRFEDKTARMLRVELEGAKAKVARLEARVNPEGEADTAAE